MHAGMDLSAEPLYDHAPGDPDARKAAQKAARSLAARVAKLHGAAPLPVAAEELLAATATEDFVVPKVVKIIEKDPALTSRLIRQVNTALGGRARCGSVTQAVTLLGVRMLRASALAASAIELFGKDEAPAAKAVVEHAVHTGVCARALAPHAGLAADEMYTAGLLADVGKLMLLRGDDAEYAALLADAPPGDDVHLEERKRFGYDHALLAGHVLAAWKLPHPLPRVVAWHHQPARAYRSTGQVPRMVALLRVADRLADLPAEGFVEAATRELAKLGDEVGVLGFAEDALPTLAAAVARELHPEPEELEVAVMEPPSARGIPLTPRLVRPPVTAPVSLPPGPMPEPAPPASDRTPTHAASPAPSPVHLAAAGALFAAGAAYGRLSPAWLREDGLFAATVAVVLAAVLIVAAARAQADRRRHA
jgi:HD-like signal output (HDOD) protein